LRESLFAVLQPELAGTRFADLFAGTGAVGLEALSRGAASVVFVEAAGRACEVLRENIRALAAADATVIGQPVKKAVARLNADIVFLDPPYDDARAYTETLEALKDSTARLILVQHQPKLQLAERYGHFHQSRRLQQGDNAVSFYRPLEAGAPGDDATPTP
jgi:16S rRNA (guanine(966)-N(2))-methyltransferase RsmD